MEAIGRFIGSARVLYPLLCSPLAFVFIPVLQNDTEYLADPAKFVLEYLGKTATILFIIVMAITPLRMIFPKSPIMKAFVFRRRQIGVSVFVYAMLHLLVYIPYTGNVDTFFADWGKPFILSGLAALVMLFLMAMTSNKASIRKMGAKRWKRLHYLAYPVLALIMYHQAAQEKTGFRETMIYFAPLILLESYRLARWLRKRLMRCRER